MKINAGGLIVNQADATVSITNRAFFNGDSVKEVLRFVNGEIKDWEDHYFNLMASMRICRMNIPLSFTPEFFQEQIQLVAQANEVTNGKILFFVYRENNPDLLKADINFVVEIQKSNNNWELLLNDAEIDVYKDYAINQSFYSLINTQKPEEYIAEIYRLENEYADLILLNPTKRMARSLKGSIFILKDGQLKTPKAEEGVITSVLRNNFIKKINSSEEFKVEETEIFPFEIQKADEVFILVDGEGILSITQNRKKHYPSTKTKQIFNLYFQD